MIRLIFTAAICGLVSGISFDAVAETVSEGTVERVCGDKIEGGCLGALCSTGCRVTENGKAVDYGCTFPNKTGKTTATCTRTPIGRAAPTTTDNKLGGTRPLLKSN